MKYLILLLCSFALQSHAFKVIIDPGHGGHDHGAVRGPNTESKITLKISQKLEYLLKRNPRFSTHLTRDTDKFLSLRERAEIANINHGDLFISIHVNSSADKRAKGAEIYFQNQLPPDEDALFLANRENTHHGGLDNAAKMYSDTPKNLPKNVYSIVEDLKRNIRIRQSGDFSKALDKYWTGFRKRHKKYSIRQAPFYVINNVNMPSALIELGFVTNPKEAHLLASDHYQNQIARSIYQGIIKFKESMDKRSESSLH